MVYKVVFNWNNSKLIVWIYKIISLKKIYKYNEKENKTKKTKIKN